MVLTHLSKKCSLKLMNLGCDANDVPIIMFTFYSVHHVRSYTSTAVGCTPHADLPFLHPSLWWIHTEEPQSLLSVFLPGNALYSV